ncbi:hypothetical protein LCGC14_1884260 [marine sediment metagenome]|uniref:Uncharacterized protein n=1 Tax=marine sediment metagenome TaxID=412755 RepID=A0A0F9IZM7_9ZZZZ
MGRVGKDKITGFVGTVTGRSEYINGCVHLMLEAKAKPGMKPVHAWFDEARIQPARKTVKQKPRYRSRGTHGPGGPMPHSV